MLKLYENVTPDDLRANYKYFLERIIPTCEKCGVRMAVHPDDPAWPIFGLPRIAHSQADFDKIVAMVDSPANALCLCTGSLGSNPENDVPGAIRHFGAMNRIRLPARPQREIPRLPQIPRGLAPVERRLARHVRD